MQSLCAASLVFRLHCRPGLARPRSTGVMSFFLNFTFVSGISLFLQHLRFFGKVLKMLLMWGVMLGLD